MLACSKDQLVVGKLVGKFERAQDGKFVLAEGSKCEPVVLVCKQVLVHSIELVQEHNMVQVHTLVQVHSIELVQEHSKVLVLVHNTEQVLDKQDHKLQVHNILEHE